ncbi:MAG: ORF6N domain-containing protein [Elusimicrobia bacterium]|nr:ORF6N domain-containing protein [Elusimicrobiota bacterium]
MDNPTTPQLEQIIFLIRGQKVMLSTDLARLYEVEPRALIQAVKRNRERFPDGFMFQLTLEEANSLRSQFVILKRGRHIKHAPYAFTEYGVVMLSAVLNSRRAYRINVAVVRTFVRIRETLSLHKELAGKMEALERRITDHDAKIQTVFDAITELTQGGQTAPRKIGFTPEQRAKRPDERSNS